MTDRLAAVLLMASVWVVSVVATVVGGERPSFATIKTDASVTKPIPGINEAGFSVEGFSIGTRVTHFQLETERKNTFLGHIDKMESIQDNSPTKLYADWWFVRYAGAELTWDRVEARTHNDDPEGISDGNLIAEGPIATLMARYPNKTRVTPYVGYGCAFMSIAFEEEPWWALGYDGPESYAEMGNPTIPRNGKTREMLPDSSALGIVMVAGLDVRIFQHWSAGVYWRHMDLDTSMGYRTAGDIKGDRTIPLSNMAYGAGVKYIF